MQQERTLLQHIVEAIRIGPNPVIAMFEFKAYFDASGDPRSAVMSVVCFISRYQKWKRFEAEWKALLPPEIPMFHMTDFVSFKGGWEGWRGKPERGPLFDSLIGCIKKHTNKGFGVSMRLKDYQEFDSKYGAEKHFGGPYSLLGMYCFSELQKWAVRHNVDYRRILCILEDGDEGQGELERRVRFDDWNAIPQKKKDIRAFDSCDLAAWKARTLTDDFMIKELHAEDPAGLERMLKAFDLLKPILHVNPVMKRQDLESLAALAEIKPKAEMEPAE